MVDPIESSESTVTQDIKNINASLNRVFDLISRIDERLNLLDKDLAERSIKRLMISATIKSYPLLLILLVLMLHGDTHKVASIVSDIKDIVQNMQIK